MSAGEVITTSSTGAQKAGNLERFDLIPVEALRELAEHFGRGALKYDDRNWEKGYEWGKSYAALCRHLTQFWAGEDIDPETGSKHIIAVAWHAFVLATFMDRFPEFDDRVILETVEGVINDAGLFVRAVDVQHPLEVTSLAEEWTRQFDWQINTSSPAGSTYKWLADGECGPGWYVLYPEDDEAFWSLENVGRALGQYDRFVRV
ncbi:hypothetical protein PBI_MRMAGOO_88 [Mycobacterium phage MrMagoo]|uniref:dATP/dGTP diphosphohydrolase N-terminal domain-containing protein n=1 Tax=Mycobacterium phage MrMagoo TaxID=1927020 RepID=A0A1L6BYM9_9CAUD|nr:hypothetical protein J4U04_gp088 [Mycobacterium phage MrMagoo]APQ42191.1 hypothetical protein PBI_MRMAGOO_88 [Mycobacterium phage MrMagoo]ARM70266.1 hypothetical protein SEA_GARDENSALSA_88 [Mycobacterium phage GardenSalsa]